MEKVKTSYILKLAVMGILLMFISAAAIMKIIFMLSTISMPDFTGMPAERAQKIASRMKIDDQIFSPIYESGCVVSQDIPARTEIKKGRTVYIVTSKGSKTVTIPDISAQAKSAAVIMVRNAGLLDGNDTVVSSPIYKDTTVISQSPAAGQQSPAGIKVNMLRSSGPRKPDFMMPDLTGMKAFEAFGMLRKNKLLIDKLTVEPREDIDSGTILEQDPPAGYLINEKTPISFKASIKESDTTLKKRIVKITYSNPGNLPVLVKINVLSLSGSEVLYNEVAQPNEPINVNAAIRGEALVQIWNGTELAKEMEFKN